MEINHSTGSIVSLLNVDTSIAPPQGVAGVFHIIGTGGLIVPKGATADRPASHVAGTLRFNTTDGLFEFDNGTDWIQIRKPNVTIATQDGLTVATDGASFSSSVTLTNDGTFTLKLDSDLVELAALTGEGLVARAANGTYSSIEVVGTAGNIVVTNGTTAPAIDLATVGSVVTDSFQRITTDAFGRVTATAAVEFGDIVASLGYTPVDVAGDTMLGTLTLVGAPTENQHAATKQYVDALVSAGATWRNPVVDVNLVDIVSAAPSTPVVGESYIVSASWGSFSANDVVTWDGSAWVKITTLATGQRFIIAGETGSAAGAGLPTGFVKGDLIQYVSGTVSAAGSWTRPEGFVNPATGQTEIPQGTTVLVNSTLSQHYGHAYLYNADNNGWTEIAGPGSIGAGNGLSYVGNTLNLDLVSIENGGTGLDATGNANQLLGVASASGTLEYKTIQGSDYISVTHAAGSITIANTGVTEVTASTTSTGLTFTASSNKGNVDFVADLGTELQGLAQLSALGFVSRTAAGTYVQRSLTNTDGNIVITNANGVNGNPTLELVTISQGTGSNFVKVDLDNYGRVIGNSAVSAADIRGLTPYTNGTGLSLTDGTFSITNIGTAVTDSFVKITTNAQGQVTATSAVTAQNVRDLTPFSVTSATGLSFDSSTGVFAITTVPTANGGTGLTTVGAAGTLLSAKADGTLEYKTIGTSGAGISVTNIDGSITLANTGVTGLIAGTGMAVSAATGEITISNTGVTSIEVTGGKGVTINGTAGTVAQAATATVTTTGTIAITLASELQSLVGITQTGLISNNSGTYISRTLTGTAGNIVIIDPDGVAGNPTFNLAPVTQASSGDFVKVTLDGFGRVTGNTAVTTADITALVDATYVNVTGDTLSGSLTFTSGTVTGLPTPVNSSDAANKAYVDAAIQGLTPKAVVRVATVAAGTLATAFAAGQVVDGVTLVAGDRILIKNQASAAENGIYVVAASGAPTRALDNNEWAEVPNAYVFVSEGTLSDTGWVCTSNAGGTLDTTAMDWVQFAGAGTYTAGNGITINGKEISLSSPVTVANGGTGLSTAGSAHQMLGVKADGTLEYKTITTSGSGVSVTAADGSITIANTGVTALAVGTGLAIDGSTGSLTVSLDSDLQSLSALSGSGFLVRKSDNSYTEVTISGTTGNIVFNNGNGSSAPSVDLATVTQASSGNFVKVSLDSYGRVSGNTAVVAQDVRDLTPFSVTSATGLSLNSSTGVFEITTVPTANGGTGLTSVGSANQVLGVNAAGTGLEYKTVTAGLGIDVTNSAGVLTIANTGVTSVGLSLPSIFSVSNSPVTTTGTLTASLATQAANTIFMGPASGVDAAPTFRALTPADLPIQLYTENAVSPAANVASGDNSVAIGSGASATADEAIAFGAGSLAAVKGAKAFANGSFAAAGDAQSGLYVLRNVTTDATTTELFLDGSAAQLVIPDNSAVTYQVMVVGKRTDAATGTSELAAYRIEGVVFKESGASSVSYVGTPSKVILGERLSPDDSAWDANVSVDTSTGAMKVTVNGEASKNIRWVATVITAEVVTA